MMHRLLCLVHSLSIPRMLIWVCLAASVITVLDTSFAYAQTAGGGGMLPDASQPADLAGGMKGNASEYDISKCPGEGIASRFVPCIRDVVMNSASIMFKEVYPFFERAIYILLTLSVLLYGTMLVTQWIPTPKASTETFMLIIKIGAVVGFTANIEVIYFLVVQILDGMIESVTNYSFSGYGGSSLRCAPGTKFGGGTLSGTTPPYMFLWHRVDCVLDRIIGINANAGQEISNGILGFLWDNAFTGAMGIMVFLGGLYMLASLVMGLFRAIAQYIISLMILALLVLVSLIFIPLILFKQTTGEHFRKWVKILISTILQPVVVFAFLSVLITALDVTMFSGQNSFYRTVAGENSTEADFSLSRYMDENNLYRRRQVGPYTHDTAPPPGQAPTAEANTRNATNTPDNPRPRTNGSMTELLVGIEYQEIDWPRLCSMRGSSAPTIDCGNANETMRQAVGNSLIMCIITAFLLVQMMNQVPLLAQDLTGGVRETINTGLLARSTIGMSQGVSNVTNNFSQRIQGLVGARRGGAR